MFVSSIIIIGFGFVVLTYGNRLALFGAGVGVLLGIGFLRVLPGAQDNLLWMLLPAGLAILFALGAGMARQLIGLVTLALGALAGGAITLAIIDLFMLDLGLMKWLLALIGAVIGAGLLARFKGWTVIILAGIVGALLCVRGLQMAFPIVQGFVASLIGLILVGFGIAYQGGYIRRLRDR